MEKWLVPKQKTKLVKRLLQIATENNWTLLFEYSVEGTGDFLEQAATEVAMPVSGEHHYEKSCKLVAIKNPATTNGFTKELMQKTHVMSAHDANGMVFLFADDYHKHCLSCSIAFYNQYRSMLCDQELIDCRS